MGIRLGGRQKGTPNKVTKEVKELARSLFDAAYWRAKRAAVRDGTCPPVIEAKLLAYAYGEPKQEHQVTHGVTVNIGFLQRAPLRDTLAAHVVTLDVPQHDTLDVSQQHTPDAPGHEPGHDSPDAPAGFLETSRSDSG